MHPSRDAWTDLQLFRSPSPDRRWWWYYHMERIVGSYIALSTALMVQQVGPRLPESIEWLAWVAPTAIGTPLLVHWISQYRRKFLPSKNIMPSLVSQIRTNWPKIVSDYVVRDLTGLLSLVAVAAFDVGSNPAGSETRYQLLALHSLLFVCFVGSGIIVRWRAISGHLILLTLVAIQLLLVYVGSNATTQIALCFMFSAYAHELLDDVTAYFKSMLTKQKRWLRQKNATAWHANCMTR